MLLVPCGQRKWQIGKVPQSVGKAFEVSMLALIPHCPMPHQRTVPENNVYRIGLNTLSSNTVVKKISVARLVSISTGEFFDIFSMFSCLLMFFLLFFYLSAFLYTDCFSCSFAELQCFYSYMFLSQNKWTYCSVNLGMCTMKCIFGMMDSPGYNCLNLV